MKTNIIYNMDCIEGMLEHVDEDSVDLILTDPPFAIGFKPNKANYNRDFDNVIDDYEEIEVDDYDNFTHEWIGQATKVLKENGSMYVFSGWNHLEIMLKHLRIYDFKIINHIIWKYAFGVNCKKKFITSHYHLLYVAKNPKKVKFFTFSRFQKNEKTEDGKRNARYADMEDVWIINRENWTGMEKSPTKLPGEIIKKILSYSSEEGDMVLDPFSGSGQVPWFCKKMDRKHIGFEKSKKIFDFCMRRFNENKYLLERKKEKV